MDPAISPLFRVSIAGETFPVSRVSEISVDMEPVRLPNGGSHRRLAAREVFQLSRIRLEIPLAAGRCNALDSWWEDITDPAKALTKKIVDIVRLDSEGNENHGWRLKDAWVCGVGVAPISKEGATSVLCEFFDFVYEEMESGPKSPAPAKAKSPAQGVVPPTVRAGATKARETLDGAYRDHPQFDHAPDRIEDHVMGVNLEEPVVTKTLPPGTVIVQFERINESAGMYAAYPGTSPETLGINPLRRVETHYKVTEPMTVVESTAADFPSGLAQGVGGGGGSKQLLLPPDWRSKVHKLPRVRGK